jgi:hypothetical protein
MVSEGDRMQNEDPETSSASDARRWVSVYSELVHFEEEMLIRIRERMRTLSTLAREEAERSNVPALEEDCRRFRSRLGYWEKRLSTLSPKSQS